MSAEETTEHLELLILDMANDKLYAWFMHAMQAAYLIAIVKNKTGTLVDHKPVGFLNTLSSNADKGILQQFQTDYVKELMPQQLGVGVNFAAELIIMGLRMAMHLKPDFVLVDIDLENAYTKIWRVAVLRGHLGRRRLCGLLPYLSGKLGPRTPMWDKDNAIYDEEGLLQGGAISSSAFSFTIPP
jgi:hypothetical protein